MELQSVRELQLAVIAQFRSCWCIGAWAFAVWQGTLDVVQDFVYPGSSLALRSLGLAGSGVLVHGLSCFGSGFSMSVLDCLHLGSS